ncbi:hypothetical protein RFI_28851, partial [Reticulomyxa filosa]
MQKVFLDYKSAMLNPPADPFERSLLFSRVRKYSVRFQYVMWNILAVVCVYSWDDSVLREWIEHDYASRNILYHLVQLASIVLYCLTTFGDPGFVPLFTGEGYFKKRGREKFAKCRFLIFFFLKTYVLEEQKRFENKLKNEVATPQKKSQSIVDDKSKNAKENEENRNDNGDNNNDDDDDDDDDEETSSMMKTGIHNVGEEKVARVSRAHPPEQFCYRCKFLRPMRSKHCYDCDRCVIKFDHHCPFMGNCIGGYNHRYFVLFGWVQSIVVIGAVLSADDYAKRTAIGWISRVLYMLLISFGLFAAISITGFHTYLMATGQTTFEMMR